MFNKNIFLHRSRWDIIINPAKYLSSYKNIFIIIYKKISKQLN